MSAPPRTVARWSPRIECSRPVLRWSLLKASALFGVLLIGQLALVTHLVSGDLSRQHIVESLQSYRDDLQQLQKRIDEIMKEEGKYDLFALKEKLTVLTRAVNDRFSKQLAIEHLAVYDVQGRRVIAVTGLRKSLIRREAPQVAPEFRKPGEIPDVKSSPAVAGGAADGASEGPSGDSANGAADGDAGQDGEARAGGVNGQEDGSQDSPKRPVEGGQMGPPAPPGRMHLDSATRETLIVVPVGTGSPTGDPKGIIELGVNRELLEAEAADLRRTLMKKLVAGGFLSLVLLVVGFLYVLKLIQKTRRLEAEAQMADRLAYIGTLASGLAHEIRNPLNAMNMNLQMIEEELSMAGARASLPDPPRAEPEETDEGDGETRALLDSTRGEIKRLERLVSSFLAYARPSTLHVEERDLNQTVEDLVRFLKAELASGGIEISTDLDPDLPPVAVDEAQLKQAMLNIVVNARQVLTPGGRIDMRTGRTAQGEIFLRISDDGPGIPSDQIDRIFEVFYSNRRGGTGLGLPIAQRIVQNHGGRIEVESGPGAGTAFTILLPIEPRPVPASAPAPEPARTA